MISPLQIRRVAFAALAATAALLAVSAASAAAADYVPGEIVVAYKPVPVAADASAIVTLMGIRTVAAPAPEPRVRILRLPRGLSVSAAIARLRHLPGVAYVVPNLVAHMAGTYLPNDPGTSHRAGGWQALQWNFLPGTGVNAPRAWANLIADHRPGGRGVMIAVLDTGIAYRRWRQFWPSPDFNRTKFVNPYDFVSRNRYPLDREGHGTFVAGEIAESTGNGIGLTGLAYGASIMPVRVLDSQGNGDAATISRGIRYAVTHGAKVINLSLEFPLDTTSADIPDILSALDFAHRHGVVVVGAAGNEGSAQIAYPARAPVVISVGSTTRDRCLAYYSNDGPGLDLVAPGGGEDASVASDPNCGQSATLPPIFQLTFVAPDWHSFSIQNSIGTSMSSPEVAAAAALVIASGVIGRHPTPGQILTRLEQTATPLGGAKPNSTYGYGLLDAGAATAP